MATCKQCRNMDECSFDAACNNAVFDPESSAKYCTGFEPYTVADRIRAMTDEELAKRLLTIDGPGVFCKTLPECEELLDTDEGIPEGKCLRCMLAWLQQPVEE